MRSAHRHLARRRGFTLIELIIAVAILGIITAIALPSFMDSIRKGRRAEGFSALASVQQAQERWRGFRPTYANDLSAAWPATPNAAGGLNIQGTTANSRYQLVLSGGASSYATGYEIKATAYGSQTSDTRCAVLALRQVGGQVEYGSGASSIDWTDANGCWAK